jgi:hypothetical protein
MCSYKVFITKPEKLIKHEVKKMLYRKIFHIKLGENHYNVITSPIICKKCTSKLIII